MGKDKEKERVPTPEMKEAQAKLNERLERIRPFMPKPDQKLEVAATHWTLAKSLFGAACIDAHK